MSNCIIPVESFSKKLKLYFFGESEGYDDIVIVNSITGKMVQHIQGAKNYMERDVFFPYKTITISGLEAGRYDVFAMDAGRTKRTDSVKCIVTGDSKQTMLKTAIRLSGVENNDVDLLVEDISDKSNVQGWLFKKYLEVDEEDDEFLKMDIALVLDAYISILNTRIKNLHLTYPNFEINQFDGSFELDPSAARVVRFDITHSCADQIEPEMLTNKQLMSMRDDTLYLYVEVDDNGLPMSQQIVFVPSYEIRNKLVQKEIERIENYKAAIETTIEYPASYLEFSEQEREYITLIDKLQPDTAWVTAPKLTIESAYISAEINNDDKPFFSVVGEDLYLAFSETELCLVENNQRTIPLPRSTRFLMDDLNMLDEDYFYWIENGQGKIISDIRLFNPARDDYNDFNNRVRLLFLSKYQDHLLPYASVKHGDSVQDIKEAVSSCIEEDDVSISNLHTKVLERLCTSKKMRQFSDFAMCMEEDHTLYGDYYVQFFDGPVRYKYKQDTIVLPPGEGILYRIDVYNFDSHKTYYIPCEYFTAIEHRFYDDEYAVISAINMDDMKMSGFILLDYSASNIRANVYQFLVNTAEVIY